MTDPKQPSPHADPHLSRSADASVTGRVCICTCDKCLDGGTCICEDCCGPAVSVTKDSS